MKKIKVAIWGLGRAGWGMHTHEIDRCPGCYEIAGCYDILPERMAQMQKKYPACKAYSSPEEMLADPEIELVAVAVRSRDHVKFDIQVLEAGKYLIAEKPIAVSYAEAMKLKEVSDRHLGKMFCRQNRRFEACFQQALRQIVLRKIDGDKVNLSGAFPSGARCALFLSACVSGWSTSKTGYFSANSSSRNAKVSSPAPRLTYCFAPVRAAVFSIRSVYAARHRGEGARCVLTSHRRISCAPAFALRLCVWRIYSSVFPFCACTKRSIA